MVNKNFIYLVITFLITGCLGKNSSIIETPSPVNVLPTTSFTFSPTKAITVSSTPQIIQPTPTIYLSALPTLSIEQEENKFYRFYNFIDQCHLPCLWGITPGVTTWAEMQQFINQFNNHNIIQQASWSITKTTNFDTYIWYVKNPDPNLDETSAIVLEVRDNIVTAILIEHQLSTILFPIHRLLDDYGEPDMIFLDAQQSEWDKTIYFVDVLVVYDEHIFSGYRFYEYESTDSETKRVCLEKYVVEPLTLWSSGTELNRDFSNSKLLSEFLSENEKSFYEKFRYKGNKCFEVLKEAWD